LARRSSKEDFCGRPTDRFTADRRRTRHSCPRCSWSLHSISSSLCGVFTWSSESSGQRPRKIVAKKLSRPQMCWQRRRLRGHDNYSLRGFRSPLYNAVVIMVLLGTMCSVCGAVHVCMCDCASCFGRMSAIKIMANVVDRLCPVLS
jgi:hypothetical protein